jgi:hypothetical protein
MDLQFLERPDYKTEMLVQTLTIIRGIAYLNMIGDEIDQSGLQRGLQRVPAVLFAQQSDKIAGQRKKN